MKQLIRAQIAFVFWNVGVQYHCTSSGEFYSYAIWLQQSEVPFQIPMLSFMDEEQSTICGTLILPDVLPVVGFADTSPDLLPAATVYLYDACHHGIWVHGEIYLG